MHQVLPVREHATVIGLIGNPNVGKTALFNALTGHQRHVANYPGVTVDIAKGLVRSPRAGLMELLDLPGTYSLSALSPDEMIVTDVLTGRAAEHARPECILIVLDATNLRRNLYLLSQVLEFGLPIVVAVNMIDLAAHRGLTIDCARLSANLGLPVVPIVATQAYSITPLLEAIDDVRRSTRPQQPNRPPLPLAIHDATRTFAPNLHPAERLRVLLDAEGYAEQRFLEETGDLKALTAARESIAHAGIHSSKVLVEARYAWADEILAGVEQRAAKQSRSWTARLDAILTHPVGGYAILAAVLFIVFQSIFAWAGPFMERIDLVFTWLAAQAAAALPAGVFRSLVADGIIAGVGGVLVFLPQIMILFGLITLLEECGYLARAAYLLDRPMRVVGLSGRSFVPILSGFACAIPAIMAARTIPNFRERFVTIMITPLMSCSARLPVYALIIGAFIPATTYAGGWINLQGLVLLGMYLVGFLAAAPAAWVLHLATQRGPTASFLLELPSYKRPRLKSVFRRMGVAGREFVVKAGTIILLVNLIVWALAYFPHDAAIETPIAAQAAAESWDDAQLESTIEGAHLRNSYLGRLGRAIEPAIAPLDWDWRIGVGVLASFPAREVIVATLGTLFNLGADVDESSPTLMGALANAETPDGAAVFTIPVALSVMVFFALCAQCNATLVVIGRELKSWKWPVISFVGMTAMAFIGAWLTKVIAGALLT